MLGGFQKEAWAHPRKYTYQEGKGGRADTRSEEDRPPVHPLEALEVQAVSPSASSSGSTRSSSSTRSCLDSGHDLESGVKSEVETDDQVSMSSTPSYRRGRHHVRPSESQPPPQDRIIELVRKEGVRHHVPAWMRDRKITPSILVLADSQLKYWPPNDKVCDVRMHAWPVKRWAQAIRLGEIKVECSTVVIYLEGTRRWTDILPIKNLLQGLCKVIRNLGDNPRIFISNHLPQEGGAPLDLQWCIPTSPCSRPPGVFAGQLVESLSSPCTSILCQKGRTRSLNQQITTS